MRRNVLPRWGEATSSKKNTASLTYLAYNFGVVVITVSRDSTLAARGGQGNQMFGPCPPQGIMRVQLRFATLACCVLAGCRTTQPTVTRENLVGNYIYISQDPEEKLTDHKLDHLVLQADGTYDLVQGGSTKVISEKKGRWNFYSGDSPQIDLDHAGYPVRVRGNEIRLLIDDDLGIWYAKTK